MRRAEAVLVTEAATHRKAIKHNLIQYRLNDCGYVQLSYVTQAEHAGYRHGESSISRARFMNRLITPAQYLAQMNLQTSQMIHEHAVQQRNLLQRRDKARILCLHVDLASEERQHFEQKPDVHEASPAEQGSPPIVLSMPSSLLSWHEWEYPEEG
jgi:hypothetical protein